MSKREESVDIEAKDSDSSTNSSDLVEHSQNTAFVPPNGGLQAWLQVFGGFFCIFNSWGIQTAFGAFLQYYQTDILSDKDPMQLAWIGALSSCLTTLGCVLFAPILDRGYMRHLLFFASIFTSFGMMMLSLCKAYWQVMICQGLILGLGTSILFLVGTSSIAPWFTTKRSVALGIAVSGSSIGGVIYPIMLRRLIALVGFGWATRIFGFTILATTMLSFAVIRRHAPPRKTKGLIDFAAAKDPPYLLYCLCLIPGFMGFFATLFYAQSYGVETYGTRGELLYYTTTILNAASAFGRTLINFSADHIGPFNALCPSLICSAILAFCWLAVDSLASFWVFVGLYGFFSAPLISLQSAIAAKTAPNMHSIGRRIGFLAMFAAVGIILGGPMDGIIRSEHGWMRFKLFGACTMTGSAILACAARMLYSKGKLWAKV